MAQTIASLMAVIGADLTGLNTGLRQAEGKLEGFRSKMQAVGGNLLKTGTYMTAAVSVPIIAMGTQMVRAASDFEAAANIMGVAARQSGMSLDSLRKAAILVGKDTQLVGIDAMEAADAMTTFYKAGLSTTDMFGDLNAYLESGANLSGALRAAIDMAAASELDLAQSSDIVAIAMATFSLGAEEATHIADSFVQAADASVASVGDLAEAMTTFGPTAAAYGMTLDEVNTLLALLSERGIRGAEAGTALKSMFTNMQRETPKVTAAWEALGTSMYDAEGSMRNLPDVIADINKGMSGWTEQQRNLTLQNLAGTYGMKALQTLLAEGEEGYWAMAKAIESAATAEAVGKERTKGFAAALEQLKGGIQTFMIVAGTPLIQKILTPLVQGITDFVGKLIEVDPRIMMFGLAIAGALAAIGPLMLMFGGVATAVGAIASPVGLAAIALGALAVTWIKAAGGVTWFKEKALPTITKVAEELGSLFENIRNGVGVSVILRDFFNELVDPDVMERIVDIGLEIDGLWRSIQQGDWETAGSKIWTWLQTGIRNGINLGNDWLRQKLADALGLGSAGGGYTDTMGEWVETSVSWDLIGETLKTRLSEQFTRTVEHIAMLAANLGETIRIELGNALGINGNSDVFGGENASWGRIGTELRSRLSEQFETLRGHIGVLAGRVSTWLQESIGKAFSIAPDQTIDTSTGEWVDAGFSWGGIASTLGQRLIEAMGTAIQSLIKAVPGQLVLFTSSILNWTKSEEAGEIFHSIGKSIGDFLNASLKERLSIVGGDGGSQATIKAYLRALATAATNLAAARDEIFAEIAMGIVEGFVGEIKSDWAVNLIKDAFVAMIKAANPAAALIGAMKDAWEAAKAAWPSIVRGANQTVGAIEGGFKGSRVNAEGTRSFVGGMTLVGEKGPEIVSLPRGSRIFSNAESRRLEGGGNGVSINYNSSPIINDRATGLQLLAMTRSRSLTNMARGAV